MRKELPKEQKYHKVLDGVYEVKLRCILITLVAQRFNVRV